MSAPIDFSRIPVDTELPEDFRGLLRVASWEVVTRRQFLVARRGRGGRGVMWSEVGRALRPLKPAARFKLTELRAGCAPASFDELRIGADDYNSQFEGRIRRVLGQVVDTALLAAALSVITGADGERVWLSLAGIRSKNYLGAGPGRVRAQGIVAHAEDDSWRIVLMPFSVEVPLETVPELKGAL